MNLNGVLFIMKCNNLIDLKGKHVYVQTVYHNQNRGGICDYIVLKHYTIFETLALKATQVKTRTMYLHIFLF